MKKYSFPRGTCGADLLVASGSGKALALLKDLPGNSGLQLFLFHAFVPGSVYLLMSPYTTFGRKRRHIQDLKVHFF